MTMALVGMPNSGKSTFFNGITGSHSPAQYSEYAKVARYYGFWASCGSDFHSPDESSHDLGSMPPLPADLTPVWSGLIELDAV